MSDAHAFNLSTKLIDLDTNSYASDYICNNYSHLLGIIRKLDIRPEKAADLLHDVFISVVEGERCGKCYDVNYGKADKGVISVEQYVIGRIKRYALNTKYRTDIVESGTSTYIKKSVVVNDAIECTGSGVKVAAGKDRRYVKEKVKVSSRITASSYNEGEQDIKQNSDNFQKAYAQAASAECEELEDIVEACSLQEQIDYIIDVCDLHGIKILNILKNIDEIADIMVKSAEGSKKKQSFGVFNQLVELVNVHKDVADAFISVLTYSMSNKENFSRIIAAY